MSGADSIKARCTCGAQLSIPAAAEGRRVTCPSCQRVLTVPIAEDPPALLDDLVQEAESAAPDPAHASGPRLKSCPGCRRPLAAGAVICAHCGFDARRGTVLRAPDPGRAAAADTIRKLAAGTGSYALGCTLSAAGALAGAVVWCVIALAVHLEIGWIAWGIGVLAGLGMLKGYPARNLRAGVSAAVIALAGIFAGKCLVFAYLIYPQIRQVNASLTALEDAVEQKRYQVADHRASVQATIQGWHPDGDRYEEYSSEQRQLLADMSEADLDAELAKIEAWKKNDCWNDRAYVRGFLINALVDEETRAKFGAVGDGEWEGPNVAQWIRMRAGAVTQVDLMPAEKQLERAREIDRSQTLEINTQRLAQHRTELRCVHEGLFTEDPHWEKLFEEELSKVRALPPAELNRAAADLDAWEAGARLQETEYLRLKLIHEYASSAMDDEDLLPGEDEQEDARRLREAWDRQYARASLEVQGIPPEDYARTLEEVEARRREEGLEMIRQFQSQFVRQRTSSAFGEYLRESLGLFDIVFALLAVGSAFKIAGGSEE
jgi:hypothetical protein